MTKHGTYRFWCINIYIFTDTQRIKDKEKNWQRILQCVQMTLKTEFQTKLQHYFSVRFPDDISANILYLNVKATQIISIQYKQNI